MNQSLRISNKALLELAMQFALILGFAFLAGLVSFFLTRNLFLSSARFEKLQGPTITGEGTTSIGAIGGITRAEVNRGGTESPAGVLPEESEVVEQYAPWDGTGRVTILIMGLDYRDWEAGEKASRSDTMILLTLDPLTKTAGMLSVPRDLWVAIPGYSHAKINTAHYLGDAHNLPGGGPGLAVKTVEQFLGIPINYYAVIDFEAFIRFIDEIGGVKIDVPGQITIDLLGSGSNTKKTLQPGVQVLPGQWALAYARNRHTDGGDFDRAKRQQQVIMGIRNRILSLEMLPTLITKAPKLYQELRSGINTNLELTEAIRLALLAQQIPEEKIQHAVIDQQYVVFGRSSDNLSILIPVPDKIHALRDELFASGASLGPLTPGNPEAKIRAEQARLAIYNGSRDSGLSERLAAYLQGKGANLATVGGASETYNNTTIIDHTGNPYLLKYLVELLSISPGKITIIYDPNAGVDIELFLGYDAEGVELP